MAHSSGEWLSAIRVICEIRGHNSGVCPVRRLVKFKTASYARRRQTAVAIAPKPNHSANVSGSGIGLIVTLKLPALS